MPVLMDRYNSVLAHVNELNEKISQGENEIASLSSAHAGSAAVRIAKLEEQLEKIDAYLLKVKGFQELAKRNLDSQNVLTIEAPPGYRVNMNRLRNWAMMIDPQSPNDPYAQRVFAVAKCDECFLEQKKQEFLARIQALRDNQSTDSDEEVNRLKETVAGYRGELRQYATSADVADFVQAVRQENERHWYKTAPTAFAAAQSTPAAISPGACAVPFSFEDEQKSWLKSMMGDFYDEDHGRVLLPVEISNDHEYVMTITCAPSRRKQLDQAIQNLVFASIQENPAGTRKIYVLDAVRFNSSSMGTLRQLEGSFAMERIPRNPDQLTGALEQIVSSFADMDEILELYDSVVEYNAEVEEKKKLPLSTLVLFGWPHAYEGRDRELVQKIMTNYERYGISFLTVSYQNTEKQDDREKNAMPEYAAQNAIHVSMLPKETTITFSDGKPMRFVWYVFSDSLAVDYVDSLKKYGTGKSAVGNEYIKRYSLTDRPGYVREYKKIELPFGIDGKDADHSVSFENENFATYLVGASRSGKSTLLHTLIAGLIRNYHPDNVELWLADFKQLEFKRYMEHLPPHVKYILLDESTELVYDLVDKLTAEMMDRQKLFARLGKQRIDQIDPTKLEKPLPVIFVILDEFSIMSQSIAESPMYKLKLQNILAKGAALGIKFLFSSQTFTTGVAGLTATARAQIQQRIAMKGTKEEISETLELSSNLKTEQVKNWMDALPPHYALVKFRISADTLPQVKRFLVMYFQDYEPRDRMIDDIRASMHPVEQYDPADLSSYVDKHPVLVDGNTYDAFNDSKFLDYVQAAKRSLSGDLAGDEMFLSLGSPRLMVDMKPTVLSTETRENLLLVARSAEQACAASILLSAAKSYRLQGGQVEVWAYSRNRLYKTYKQSFLDIGATVAEDMDEVCGAISKLKASIANKSSLNKLILLIGIERICMDFDYVDGDAPGGKKGETASDLHKQFEEHGAMISSEDEEAKRRYAMQWLKYRRPYVAQAKAEGKTEAEINQMLLTLETQFREEKGYAPAADSKPDAEKKTEPVEPVPETANQPDAGKAYNAQDDLVYVVKQASRFGCHMMLAINTFADLKQCGLKLEFFRYKMAFQISVEDSRDMFSSKIASTLPEHVCQFDNTLEKYSLRPYLHRSIDWEGWYVGDDGTAISPYEKLGEQET